MTREALLDGLRKRHVYGSTDNILAEFRSGDHIMGDAFTTSELPEIRREADGHGALRQGLRRAQRQVRLFRGAEDEAGEFFLEGQRAGGRQARYYYVRGEQEDGELVWVSPMWITYTPGK